MVQLCIIVLCVGGDYWVAVHLRESLKCVHGQWWMCDEGGGLSCWLLREM